VAWDSSRPVPWQRLAREWLVYVAIMAAVFFIFMRDRPLIGVFAGLLASGPLYLGIGYILAKFGYQRATLKERRVERDAEPSTSTPDAEMLEGPRPKPPPTKRTGGGTGRPGGSRKRR